MFLKRIMCVIMSAVLVAGMLPPAAVFADEMETLPEETVAATVETAAEEETTPAAETEPEETEPAAETAPEETEPTAETEPALEPAEPEAAEEPVPAEEEASEEETIFLPGNFCADGEGLFEGYLQHLFFGGCGTSTRGILAWQGLSDADKYLYSRLQPVFLEIAGGQRESATVVVEFGESGFAPQETDLDAVILALNHDCPYEMYWYDGCYIRYTDAAIQLWVQIRKNYQAEGYDPFDPRIDAANAKRAGAAAETAREIVARYAHYDDYDKLAAYADEICALVSYDKSATGETMLENVDPWTLVNVFDGDDTTNVICEGYAEAFQYLCDNSAFDSNIACYSPTGANHKWNIVRINGVSYLVDLTMGDNGDKINRAKYFLNGGKGSVEKGYKISGFHYWYYDETIALWGTGADSILKLSETRYDPVKNKLETITQEKFEAALKNCGGSYELTRKLTVGSDMEISGVALSVGEGGRITVASGAQLILAADASLTLTGENQTVVDAGGKLIAFGPAGGTITGEGDILLVRHQDGRLTVAGQGTVGDGDLDRVAGDAVSLRVMEGITGIGAKAFDGCTGLEEATFPERLETLGAYAFSGCTGLKTVFFRGDVPAAENAASVFADVSATVKYPMDNDTWTEEVRASFGGQLTWAAEDPNLLDSGTCGQNLTWRLTADGCLTITGTGAMNDYNSGNSPWYAYRQTVTEILLGEGVTEIGANAFAACEGLTRLAFPATLTKIQEGAFAGCACIKTISFHGKAPEIGETAFEGISATVCYPGGESWTEDKLQNYGGKLTWVVNACLDGHDVVVDPAVYPGCMVSGLTEGSHCADCGEVLVAQEMIPATRHNMVNGSCLNCGREDKADYTLFSGKSLTLQVTNPATNKPYTAKQIQWTLAEGSEAYASITAAGKLTAPNNYQKTRVEAIGTIPGEKKMVLRWVDIYPVMTQAELLCGGENVNGKTLLMGFDAEALTLTAAAYPADAQASVTWSVGDQKGQYADYTIDGQTLTVSAPKGKAGTLTIKATVEAGVKKTVSVKIQFGSFAKEVAIAEPAKTTLKGGESLTLTASITEPDLVTKPGIVWSVSDKTAATVSGGKVKAKNVANPTTVIVTATSKDGAASDSVELRILPKNEGQLVIMQGDAFVSGSTFVLNPGDSRTLSAAVIRDGVPVPVDAAWSSSKTAVATVDGGLITAAGNGSAKITAAYDGMKATLSVKVTTLVADLEITTKDGKNITEEAGEKLVQVASGKSVTLVAKILTPDAAKGVAWEITEGAAYAKIAASGALKANKDLTKPGYVTVKATAKDGSGYSETIRVKILPLAAGVRIYRNGIAANGALVHDMLTADTLKLSARVFPATANQAVELTSSNKKVADFNADGELVCIKPGTVTITAKALDGSGKKTSFKLTIVKRITSLTLKEDANLTVTGGKGLKLAPMIGISPEDATNKKLNWKVSDNDWGIKISTSGVLSTKKVKQAVTVNVMVTTQDGSGQMLSFQVTVTP